MISWKEIPRYVLLHVGYTLSRFPWITFMMCFSKCDINCLCKACFQLLLHRFTQIWKQNLTAAAKTWVNTSEEQIVPEYKQLAFRKHVSVYLQKMRLCTDSYSRKGLCHFSDCPCTDAEAWLSLGVYSQTGAPTGHSPWERWIAPTFCHVELVLLPRPLPWSGCGNQRSNFSLTHCKSEHR